MSSAVAVIADAFTMTLWVHNSHPPPITYCETGAPIHNVGGETIGFLCFRVELTITGAWKSLCKALEHIATAFWPPCAWNATFCYTILSEQRAQRVDFGAR